MTPALRVGGVVLAVAIAAALPFFLTDYRTFQFTQALIYAIVLLGLNLLTGYSGQISLGHGAFYAVGAYTAAILMDQAGWPYWATLPVAGAVCFGFGFLFGLPALRLHGHYLAFATFALAVATPQILKYKGIEHWTGGVQGIVTLKPDAPFGLPLSQDRWLYLFTLAIAVALFVVAWNLVRGRVGRALVALRDHPIAAEAMGVDAAFFKTTVFGISAMYAGIAGALGGIAVQFVSPDAFTTLLSISFVVGIVVGGIATISGALWGALFIQFVPNVADQISKAAPWAIYGAVLLVFIYAMPGGVAWMLRRVAGSLRRA
ncbi:MAG: branched-chain amino acid ABC transporter permease [Burkholderiales bacterium]|nr:branched-chain amino acid ABC transporter permease [Burkholderiales bacterium]